MDEAILPDLESPVPPVEVNGTPSSATLPADLRRIADVPIELAVEIGRTRMTIAECLELGPGSVITLDRLAGEPVDLLAGGRPIARGEVVVVDDEFGLRIGEVLADRAGLSDDSE